MSKNDVKTIWFETELGGQIGFHASQVKRVNVITHHITLKSGCRVKLSQDGWRTFDRKFFG